MIQHPTTTVTIKRPAQQDSLRPPFVWTVIATGVRATLNRLSRLAGAYDIMGGQVQHLPLHLVCDPVDLRYFDRVYDDADPTGLTIYAVEWVLQRKNLIGQQVGGVVTYHDYTEALLLFTRGEE